MKILDSLYFASYSESGYMMRCVMCRILWWLREYVPVLGLEPVGVGGKEAELAAGRAGSAPE